MPFDFQMADEGTIRAELLQRFCAIDTNSSGLVHAEDFQAVLKDMDLSFGDPLVDRVMLACTIREDDLVRKSTHLQFRTFHNMYAYHNHRFSGGLPRLCWGSCTRAWRRPSSRPGCWYVSGLSMSSSPCKALQVIPNSQTRMSTAF